MSERLFFGGRVRDAARRIAAYAPLVSEAGRVLSLLRERPSALNVLGVAAAVVGQAATVIANSSHLGDLAGRWRPLQVNGVDLNPWLLPHEVEAADDWVRYSFKGRGVLKHKADFCSARVEGSPEEFRSALFDHIWSTLGDAIQIAAVKERHDVFALVPHELGPSEDSPRALEIWERLEPFVLDGEPRSALLNGAPGVGKSTIVRSIVRRMQGRLLRIPVGDLDSIYAGYLEELVTFLRPEVIVIDDFDRAYGQNRLLDFFEKARRSFRLLMITTNSLDCLDTAVVRPGRFDELFPVDRLGDEFAVRLLTPQVWDRVGEEQRPLVLAWPAAYLEELRKRATKIRNVKIADEVAELDARFHRKAVPEWAQFMMGRSASDRGAGDRERALAGAVAPTA